MEFSEHSKELFRLVAENVKDFAVYTKDLEGKTLSWNPGVERLLGYAEGEWIGRHISVIFTPEDIERGELDKELRLALADGRSEDQRWHVRKDGSRFWANGLLMLLRDGEGRPLAFAKILRDDTERKMAEEELRRAKDELERRVEERTRELTLMSRTLLDEAKQRKSGEEQVRELLRRVIDVQEIERRRVARDLHDSVGQGLTALRLNLELLKAACGGQPEMCGRVEKAQEIAAGVESELDFIAWELRPAALDHIGLQAAVENFVREWSAHYKIECDFHVDGMDGHRLPPEVETNLYRIAQEALNNVYKHAAATRAEVLLERRADKFVLIVGDDGKGFVPGRAVDGEKGMGLLSMKERAEQVGGTVEIESAPGQGTTIFARVPVGAAMPEAPGG